MVKKAKRVNIANYDNSKNDTVSRGIKKRNNLMVIYDSKSKNKYKYLYCTNKK